MNGEMSGRWLGSQVCTQKKGLGRKQRFELSMDSGKEFIIISIDY